MVLAIFMSFPSAAVITIAFPSETVAVRLLMALICATKLVKVEPEVLVMTVLVPLCVTVKESLSDAPLIVSVTSADAELTVLPVAVVSQ